MLRWPCAAWAWARPRRASMREGSIPSAARKAPIASAARPAARCAWARAMGLSVGRDIVMLDTRELTLFHTFAHESYLGPQKSMERRSGTIFARVGQGVRGTIDGQGGVV